MTKYPIEVSAHIIRRAFEKAVGRSLEKILAELVTNSDDSYRRLMKQGSRGPNDIYILANRGKRRLLVVDNAEGLSENDMKECFVIYGQESKDRALGFRTRSLFGKGLRDVLFTQQFGVVKSIKEGRSAVAKFRWEERESKGEAWPHVQITAGPRVTSDLRRSLLIPGNGTSVELQVRKDIHFPQHDVLCEKIRNFYMLRAINSNPERKVTVRTTGKRGEYAETVIHFTPFEGEVIVPKKPLFLKLEELEFPIEVEVSRAHVDLTQGETGTEGRQGGLLVLDEDDNVLDLTLFKFDRDPFASRIFGTLRIKGLGKYIRDKLNQEAPEEILTETRDGFDRKTDFYKSLAAFIEPILEPVVKEEQRSRQRGRSFSQETQERLNHGMAVLNKLYEALVGKAATGDEFRGKQAFKPPVISFIRDELSITERVLTPFALLINSEAIPDGTEVRFSSSSSEIVISPEKYVVNHGEVKEGLITKIAHLNGQSAGIQALVSAEAPQGKATAEITVIPGEICYPTSGLLFDPMNVRMRQDTTRTIELYVDCEKVKIGSTIELDVDNNIDNSSFNLSESSVKLTEAHKITKEIARIRIRISSIGKIGTQSTLRAQVVPFETRASLTIVSRKDSSRMPEHGDRFKQPKFDYLADKVTTYISTDGTVIINLNDEVNKRYFGTEDPEAACEKELHCQVRLAELVLDECLTEIVSKAWGKTLDRRFPDEPATDIHRYVLEHKYEYGPSFHDAFVNLHSSTKNPPNQVADSAAAIPSS